MQGKEGKLNSGYILTIYEKMFVYGEDCPASRPYHNVIAPSRAGASLPDGHSEGPRLSKAG